MNPLARVGVYVEGNMANISKIVMINISKTPSIAENVFIDVDCSPEEVFTYTSLFKEIHDVFTNQATLVGYHKASPSIYVTRVGSFRTTYFEDPWVLPSSCASVDGLEHVGMAMSFSAAKITY
jgi:hypothetical protein